MKFQKTPLEGAFVVKVKRLEDESGYFGRVFCEDEFRDHDLAPEVVQANMSTNKLKGTLRGMHYQNNPYQETKFIRCVRGSLLDVILDLRESSSTYMQSFGVELSEENAKALYVPKGFAHGFITLEDNTTALYMVSQRYHPNAEWGIRWNDPSFTFDWPMEPICVSSKDQNWPDYSKPDNDAQIGEK